MAIELSDVVREYRVGGQQVRALDEISLRLEGGQFVSVVGPSGAGKSTLLHLLGALDSPDSGSITFDGEEIGRLSDEQQSAFRHHRVGFIFQFFNLLPTLSAWENVAVPLFYARQTNTRGPALRALERVGLESRAKHNPNELSGGERQRVAIARAIVTDPMVLLADEPTGNLDSRTGKQIMEIFHSLNEQGVTIVIVTHEPDIASQARRVVQMRDGKILSDELVGEGGSAPTPRPVEPLNQPDGPVSDVADQVPGAMEASQVAPTPRVMRGAVPAYVCGLVGMSLLAASVAISSR